MSTEVEQIVVSHISACEQDTDGALWCTTHESLLRGAECLVMIDALDLAEAVAEKVGIPHHSRSKEFALRLNCEKNGCDPKHADDRTLVPLEGWRWQEKWEASALAGHACDQMTRTVYFGLWELEPET